MVTLPRGSSVLAMPATRDAGPGSARDPLLSLLYPLRVHVRVPREIPSARWHSKPLDGFFKRPRVVLTGGEADERDSESGGEAPRKQLKKSSYSAKKEEKEALVKEAALYERYVQLLRRDVASPVSDEGKGLQSAVNECQLLTAALQTQLCSLYGVRGELSQQLTRIRLGTDPVERQTMLLSLRRQKLDAAKRFLDERYRGIDTTRRHRERETWTSPTGDFCAMAADVELFTGVQSVKQVFHAFNFYLTNQEISISEALGAITLREDVDFTDRRSVASHRLTSTTAHGIVLETNTATFDEYMPCNPDEGGRESALCMHEAIEEDALYPYDPQHRVRKAITGAVSFTSFRRPVQGSEDGADELVVALRRSAFLSIAKPQFAIADEALDDLEANLLTWGVVMFKTMREILRGMRSTDPACCTALMQ